MVSFLFFAVFEGVLLGIFARNALTNNFSADMIQPSIAKKGTNVMSANKFNTMMDMMCMPMCMCMVRAVQNNDSFLSVE